MRVRDGVDAVSAVGPDGAHRSRSHRRGSRAASVVPTTSGQQPNYRGAMPACVADIPVEGGADSGPPGAHITQRER